MLIEVRCSALFVSYYFVNTGMTPEFDKLYSELLEESKCTVETGLQLSDHANYRYQKCARSPYTNTIRRIYAGVKDGSFNYGRCDHKQRKGTAAYEECKLFHKMLRRRKILAKIATIKAKKK